MKHTLAVVIKLNCNKPYCVSTCIQYVSAGLLSKCSAKTIKQIKEQLSLKMVALSSSPSSRCSWYEPLKLLVNDPGQNEKQHLRLLKNKVDGGEPLNPISVSKL